VVFQLSGRSIVAQNDKVVEITGGDFALVDAIKPLTFFQPDGMAERLCLHLPRQPLVSHLGFEPSGGVTGRGTTAGRMLFQLIFEAIKDDAEMSPEANAYLHLAVYDLLGAHLAGLDPRPLPRHTDKLFARICGIVRERFTDPDFGPGLVAADAGVSLRYLQKLFTERGDSCGHFIQSLRLTHAQRLLKRRAQLDRKRPLSEVALASGFGDYAFFSRKFRERFGCAPGAWPSE
jgi:AraC-like DNA-binding protein